MLMMLDATKGDVQKTLLQKELESVGIRLNTKKPNIYFKVDFLQIQRQLFKNKLYIYLQHKKGGGIAFNAVCPLTKIDEKLVQLILHEYKIFNAEVKFTLPKLENQKLLRFCFLRRFCSAKIALLTI